MKHSYTTRRSTDLYGKGVADVFDASAAAAGLEVVAHDQISGKETDYKALAAKISDSGAELMYFGGITQQNAGQLWKDVRSEVHTSELQSLILISYAVFFLKI